MQPDRSLSLSEIELGPFEFGARPLELREGVFQTLRRDAPVQFFAETDYGDALPPGRGFYAVTRHADILEASRQPDVFSSAQGATSIADLPPEMLEFFDSMIGMDEPRHGRQRPILSRGFTPRALRRLED
jgi:cytochrome P450